MSSGGFSKTFGSAPEWRPRSSPATSSECDQPPSRPAVRDPVHGDQQAAATARSMPRFSGGWAGQRFCDETRSRTGSTGKSGECRRPSLTWPSPREMDQPVQQAATRRRSALRVQVGSPLPRIQCRRVHRDRCRLHPRLQCRRRRCRRSRLRIADRCFPFLLMTSTSRAPGPRMVDAEHSRTSQRRPSRYNAATILRQRQVRP